MSILELSGTRDFNWLSVDRRMGKLATAGNIRRISSDDINELMSKDRRYDSMSTCNDGELAN